MNTVIWYGCWLFLGFVLPEAFARTFGWSQGKCIMATIILALGYGVFLYVFC